MLYHKYYNHGWCVTALHKGWSAPAQFFGKLHMLKTKSTSSGGKPSGLIKKAQSLDSQSFINVIFKIITYSTDIVEKLNEVLEITAKRFNLCEASIGTFDDAAQCLRIRHMWLDKAENGQATPTTVAYTTIPATVDEIRKGQVAYYSDEAQSDHPDAPAFKQAGFAVNVIYPVFKYDTVLGYLSLSRRDNHRWTESEKNIFATISYIVESIMLRQEMENEILGANTLMDFVLQNSPAGIAVFDVQNYELIYANKIFHELRKINEEEGLGNFFEKMPENSYEHEIFIKTHEKWLNIYYNHAKWIDARDVTICSVIDITTTKRQAARIEQLAYYDPLCGIPNRAKFEIDLPRYIKSERGAVIFVDLDNFKSINDSYSHAHGDNLLRAMSRFCHDLPRHGDIYRYGGDEFVIIADMADEKEVEDICAAFIERCKKPWDLGRGTFCYCTASLGAAFYPDDADTPEDIIKCADIAVFKSKAEGKNTLTKFTPEMNAKFLDQAVLEMQMRKAINEDMDGFEIYYQPIINKDDKCVGAEAVMRWHSPGLGMLKQAEFVPLAEYLGLIDDIGNWLLAEACKQCKKWNTAFDPDFFVTVFLSNKQMRARTFIDSLREKIERYQLTPRNLILEVTEADKERDQSFAQKIIAELNKIGVTVAISGFGTGFISFLNLRNLGIDIVKIGPDMVKELSRDQFVSAFLHSIADLLHSLGRSVCIKGIETNDQLRAVRATGVDLYQGYYFAHAEQVESFEDKFL